MEFNDFPMFLGKSGNLTVLHPQMCVGLVLRTIPRDSCSAAGAEPLSVPATQRQNTECAIKALFDAV